MDEVFARELLDTQYIHTPLPLHPEKSCEARFAAKQVLARRPLYAADGMAHPPRAGGRAALQQAAGENGPLLQMRAPLRGDSWPAGATQDGYYCNFGSAKVEWRFAAEDWRGYNRLALRVKPLVAGARVAHLNAMLYNEGETPVPDRYYREGATSQDLAPGRWNDFYWEFPLLARDAVTGLDLYVYLSGQDGPMDGELLYEFCDIRLEQVAPPEHERGWACAAGGIALSTAGYLPNGQKTAVADTRAASFQLVGTRGEENGKALFSGPVSRVQHKAGSFAVLDFTAFTRPGQYRLRVGGLESPVFPIGADILDEAVWKSINLLFCQRCGGPVPHRHTTCHTDVTAAHGGVRLSFAGGWHDAADISQQVLQSGEIVHALFETAGRCRANRQLYLRLMEEAQWGLDFILRTRFGDGYRATSAGGVRWTDGLLGNMDDIHASVHNHAFENFNFAAIEAHAAHALAGYDAALAHGALRAAREDFAFAMAQWQQNSMQPFEPHEHSYGSGRSQYYASIVWAAAQLHRAGGEEGYAETAREYAEKLLACQETGGSGAPITGFFYRDETHAGIVHFNHQSREQQFMQALALLCETQPGHAARPRWEGAMRLYGGYLKALAQHAPPYGMLPAGVYRRDEVQDAATFPLMHYGASSYEEEKANYAAQLSAGVKLDENHVLRQFPVWFSFRGNSCVHLAMGKAAALLGRYFNDAALLDIGREQLYWVFGKNPFCQSLMYGVGHNYPKLYTVLMGEAAGELPVGVQTFGNEDAPYWPATCNATYKEVWTSPTARFLWLAAEYLGG